MKCPQCGAETPDQEWNCVACRINLYWASQHFEELARLRKEHGERESASTPSFLIKTHKSEMDDRAGRGLDTDNKVRQIAREAMRRKA